jgi:MHS family proline/betaine transporter-like MFS transporter
MLSLQYLMRKHYTVEQLTQGYWRIPFLCGILVGLVGMYLRKYVKDHDRIDSLLMETKKKKRNVDPRPLTPLEMAWSSRLRGSLVCVTGAVVLWAGGFYILFVWLVIYMTDLVDPPLPFAFVVNSSCLFVTMVLLFPFAGWMSDVWGRKAVMTWGGVGVALLSPVAMDVVSRGESSFGWVVAAQMVLGVCLCLYAAPMCAWMVESFPPEARLTSVAIGYNVAMALAGGMSPSLATWLVIQYGGVAAGYLLSALAIVSLLGLHLAPKHEEYL